MCLNIAVSNAKSHRTKVSYSIPNTTAGIDEAPFKETDLKIQDFVLAVLAIMNQESDFPIDGGGYMSRKRVSQSSCVHTAALPRQRITELK